MEYVTFVRLNDDELKTLQHEIAIISALGMNCPYLEELLDKMQDSN